MKKKHQRNPKLLNWPNFERKKKKEKYLTKTDYHFQNSKTYNAEKSTLNALSGFLLNFLFSLFIFVSLKWNEIMIIKFIY